MDNNTRDFLQGKRGNTELEEVEEVVELDEIDKSLEEDDRVPLDLLSVEEEEFEEIDFEDIDRDEDMWDNKEEEEEEEEETDNFDEIVWDIEDFDKLEKVDTEEISYDSIEEGGNGVLWGEEGEFEEVIVDTFESETSELEDDIMEISLDVSLFDDLDDLDDLDGIELELPLLKEIKLSLERALEFKPEALAEVLTVEELEIVDTVDDVITEVEIEPEDLVVDSNFIVCTYHRGMTIEEFLRANPKNRTSLYIEHFFNSKEIEEALNRGAILVKKGVYKI